MQFLKKVDVKMLVIFSLLLYPVAKMTMSVCSTESSPSRTGFKKLAESGTTRPIRN